MRLMAVWPRSDAAAADRLASIKIGRAEGQPLTDVRNMRITAVLTVSEITLSPVFFG